MWQYPGAGDKPRGGHSLALRQEDNWQSLVMIQLAMPALRSLGIIMNMRVGLCSTAKQQQYHKQ